MVVPLLTRLRSRQPNIGISMERFYAFVGMSRQGYYQALLRQKHQEELMDQIRKRVKEYRASKDSRAGSRTLYYNLGIKEEYGLGVNKFESMLSAHGLCLKPLRIRVVTTQSTKQSWNYPDLLKGLVISRINELVVGDLTFIIYGKDRYYLFLLTDVYSARIVGWSLSTRMRAQEALEALMKWKLLRGTEALTGCVHHTDGGSQYFSKLYMGAMEKLQLNISVARSCLDNGFAEQRNGLFKNHLLPLLDSNMYIQRLKQEVKRLIHIYNQERKQKKLGWKSPVEYETYWEGREDSPLMRMYDRDQNMRTIRFGF